jgi:hypothetical protein
MLSRTLIFHAFLLLLSVAAFGQSSQPTAAQIVDVPSGSLQLKAYLWKPDGLGAFPVVFLNHGSVSITRTPQVQTTSGSRKRWVEF